jgi:predicted nucleic acid-binding protein
MSPATRLPSLDVMRGTLMVLMALDHVGLMVGRFHSQEMWAGAWSRYQSALPFLTRFVTHFCAPGFFFLMGAGVSLLAASRTVEGSTRRQVERRVIVRGALPVVVEADVLEMFLRHFRVVDVSRPIAREAVTLRTSHRLKLPDAIIWPTARVEGAELITRNTKDFRRGTAGVRVPYSPTS